MNGALAKRSPGSALKPFIYALGFDQGVLHPQTMLRDVPTAFGPFTPENFDGRFLGPITATEALIRSRNIPAVWVASKLKSPSLYHFLKNAGIRRMASEDHYGLALVLGGGEVTLEELGRLYAMLANRGMLPPLRSSASDPRAQGVRMLSDEASFMALDMLRQNPRPDDATIAQPGASARVLENRHVVGIPRRLDGGRRRAVRARRVDRQFRRRGNPAFVGVEAAAPLFFHIADALRARDPSMSRTAARAAGASRSACRSASPAATCPTRGVRRKAPRGSSRASRRSASARCIAR